ncbi:hypothetical protein AAFF_G00122300 [Aldrovandia affinis]|uniref:Uncharacterized protein n=1 Tax=Aldrovandia affinis TaxID=143900 RepID=A0AAD7RS66_9TELE|nr:hypothetical protein AAFF_G00122300 [Aldrovandia affinis]
MITGRLGEPPLAVAEMSDADPLGDNRPDTPDSELGEPLPHPRGLRWGGQSLRETLRRTLDGNAAVYSMVKMWWEACDIIRPNERSRGRTPTRGWGRHFAPRCRGRPRDDRPLYSDETGAQGNFPECDRPETPVEQDQLNQFFPSYQHLLAVQQLASAVTGVIPAAPPGLSQPVLLPFNVAGQLSGHQGLVLAMPAASLANINIQGLLAAASAGGVMALPLQNLQGKRRPD